MNNVEGKGRRQMRKAKMEGKGGRQKAKASEVIDRRIEQIWQRQNTNAEAKV